MRIESYNTLPVDSFRVERAAVESVVTAKAPKSNDSEITQAQKNLQKEKRSAEEIQKDIDAINKQLIIMNRSIQFSIDKSTQDIVVRVVDKESGKVIRQLPPESALHLREHMAEITGLIFEENV